MTSGVPRPRHRGRARRGDLERLRRVLLAEAEAILLEASILVPSRVPADTGFVAEGGRGLPARRGGDRWSVRDVVPFAFAAAAAPAGGRGAAGAGGERR